MEPERGEGGGPVSPEDVDLGSFVRNQVVRGSAGALPTETPNVVPTVAGPEFGLHEEAFAYLSLVFGLAIGIIIVILASAVFFWWIRRKDWYSCYKKTPSIRYKQVAMSDMDEKKRPGSSTPEKPKLFTTHYLSSGGSPTSPPHASGLEVTAGHLILTYIEDYLLNKNKLEEEWQALETYIPDDVSTDEALLKENQPKNRYPDSLPYDHSRVKLDPKHHPSHSDYTNASFVFDSNPSKPEYIVAQGPLASTSGDFWQMVWEQNVSILVLLTKINDRGLPQCFQYWPSTGTKSYGTFKVQLVSEHVFSTDYVVRSFYVHDTRRGGSRTVTQLHFLSWTSTGIPPSATPLLKFRRKIHKALTDDSPMLVHCSDGMGRSGTFCLIDMSIRRIGRAKEINLAATVEHLRDQRANLVKNKEQYEFALTALVEETQSLLRAVE